MKEECKVSCVKETVWSIAVQEGTNILTFYIFEYGAECSAESGGKKYFISFMTKVCAFHFVELSGNSVCILIISS